MKHDDPFYAPIPEDDPPRWKFMLVWSILIEFSAAFWFAIYELVRWAK